LLVSHDELKRQPTVFKLNRLKIILFGAPYEELSTSFKVAHRFFSVKILLPLFHISAAALHSETESTIA